MQQRRSQLFKALPLLAVAVWAGCGGDDPTGPPIVPTVSSVVVTPNTSTLVSFDATVQLSASARDISGNSVSGQTFTWASSNTAIATVSGSGVVTAVGNGTATVTASAGSVDGTAVVTVTQAVTSVMVTPSTSQFELGTNQQFSAVAMDANDNEVTGASFLWSSSNPAVATVTQNGLATGVSAGNTEITAASGSLGGTAAVTITVPAGVSAALSTVSVSLSTGLPADGFSQSEITVTLRDAAGSPVQGETVVLGVVAQPALPGAALVQPTATSDANGIVTGFIASSSYGSKQIVATVGSVEITQQPTVSFGATQLVWTQSPGTALSGYRWGAATVAYQDSDGNIVTNAARSVTVELTTNPSNGSIMGGALTQAPVNGVVTFDDHAIAFPGTDYVVTAMPAGVQPNYTIPASASNPFNVSAVPVVAGTVNLTTLDNADDAAESVLFSSFTNFPFYGVQFGSVQVTTNGFLAFTVDAITQYTNAPIPTAGNPNALIAGFWDDLNPGAAGSVLWSVTGTAPNRRFVVEYRNVAFYLNTGSASFNIILHETTNRIQFVYGAITHPTVGRATGGSATIGIENGDGTLGTQIGFNTANTVRAGMSILFEYDGTNYQRIVLDP